MCMVKMLSRKEWVVEEEPMLIRLTSSHHSLGGPPLEVLSDGAQVSCVYCAVFFAFSM
jgi:hypothetical protein